MNVIFIASLQEKESRQFHYLAIIELLENLDHQVSHTHLTDFDIRQISRSPDLNSRFHQRIFQALSLADLVVAEVSGKSLALGFVIGQALKENKPVLALTSEETPPLAIFLEKKQNIVAHRYNSVRELERKLPFLIAQLEPQRPKKFNLFLSWGLDQYLTTASRQNQLSKSEYLRQLLKNDQNSRL